MKHARIVASFSSKSMVSDSDKWFIVSYKRNRFYISSFEVPFNWKRFAVGFEAQEPVVELIRQKM